MMSTLGLEQLIQQQQQLQQEQEQQQQLQQLQQLQQQQQQQHQQLQQLHQQLQQQQQQHQHHQQHPQQQQQQQQPEKEFLSYLWNGDTYIGVVRVRPRTDAAYLPYVFENKTMRIGSFSPSSERCQPLAVIHSISTTGLWFVLDASADPRHISGNGLEQLFTACISDLKTAMVPMEGGNELHLVAMPTSSASGQPCFWGFVAAEGTYASCVSMLSLRCMSLVFDLDDTLLVANTMRSFEDRIEALTNKLHVELDPERSATFFAELKRYQEDKAILTQYLESDTVSDNGRLFKVQCETVPSFGAGPALERPIIRLPDRNIILTRINPGVRDTSVLVRLRPAWEELRNYLTAKGRKRFEVFVCTMSEKDYALEMWRLLDPDARLIPSVQLHERVVCVKSVCKKSLFNVFRTGSCHPRLAMIIDDRIKVWEDVDQPRVHVVPAFLPYYAPQAEIAGPLPILCIARNVVGNVRGGFFKDFDENLSRSLNAADLLADPSSLPKPLDVSDYLTREKDQALLVGPALEFTSGREVSDGMADSETEIARDPQAAPPAPLLPSTSWSAGEINSNLQPALVNLISQLASSKEQQATMPAVVVDTSAESEEGEVPESELDPDTRRRLLILQHGQDTLRRPSSEWDEEDSPRPGSSERGDNLFGGRRFSDERGQRKLVDYSDEDHRLNGVKDPVTILKSMSQKCKAQLEFRSSISSTVDLQFCTEVLWNGERIARGIGRTSRDARFRGCEDAIRLLSGSNVDEQRPLQNGVQAQWNPVPVPQAPKVPAFNVPAFNAVAALNDLCTIENLSVVFHDLELEKHLIPMVYNCEVEISGKIMGRGRGPSWEAARQEASEEALRGMKSHNNSTKRTHSPRLPAVSKRGRGGRGRGGGRMSMSSSSPRRPPAQQAGRMPK